MPGIGLLATQTYVLHRLLAENLSIEPSLTYLAEMQEGSAPVIIKEVRIKNLLHAAYVERQIECLHSLGTLIQFRFDHTSQVELNTKSPKSKSTLERIYTFAFWATPGCNLNAFISNNTFNPKEWFSIIYGMITAIEFIHAHGYAHRDIKADNFVLNKKGITCIDFEKSIKEVYAKDNYQCGNLCFLASESHWSLENPVNNQRSDIASLGYTLLFIFGFFKTKEFGRTTDSFDFEKQVPLRLKECWNFTEMEARLLSDLIRRMIEPNIELRINLHEAKKMIAILYLPEELSLEWVEHKKSPPIKNDGNNFVEANTLTIAGIDLSELKLHGYKDLKVKKRTPVTESRSISFETRQADSKLFLVQEESQDIEYYAIINDLHHCINVLEHYIRTNTEKNINQAKSLQSLVDRIIHGHPSHYRSDFYSKLKKVQGYFEKKDPLQATFSQLENIIYNLCESDTISPASLSQNSSKQTSRKTSIDEEDLTYSFTPSLLVHSLWEKLPVSPENKHKDTGLENNFKKE